MPRVQVITSADDATDPSGSERTAILQPFPVPGRPDGEWMTDGKEGYKARYFLRLTRPADGRVAYLPQSLGLATPEASRDQIASCADRIPAFVREHTDATHLQTILEEWAAGKQSSAPILEARWILGAAYVQPILEKVFTFRREKSKTEEAARAAERKAKAEEADKEALAKALDAFRANDQLSATQWERLASLVGYDWHPRTLGSLRKRVAAMAPDGAGIINRYKGQSAQWPAGVRQAVVAIAALIKEREAPPDPQEATPEQIAHLFGKN
jgi:hypothetical protein